MSSKVPQVDNSGVDALVLAKSTSSDIIKMVLTAIQYAGFNKKEVYQRTNTFALTYVLVLVLACKGTGPLKEKNKGKYPDPEMDAVRDFWDGYQSGTRPIKSSMWLTTYAGWLLKYLSENSVESPWIEALEGGIKGLPQELHFLGLTTVVVGLGDEIGDFEHLYVKFLKAVSGLTKNDPGEVEDYVKLAKQTPSQVYCNQTGYYTKRGTNSHVKITWMMQKKASKNIISK